MPAISSTSLLNTLAPRNVTVTSNTTNPALQVICAFPVSGQYGPGSRILYYVLIAACVFARKSQWLKTACLAAALFFPAVAALHGIVLAALHVDDAVDMDIYGAFQLCSIGILAAPVTVRLSTTYFYDPGRNIIFVWTGLVLSGLLSLTVEFFRVNTSPCLTDNNGRSITSIKSFPYGNATCGLTCDVAQGPFSPLRQGSANNIYVIPAPQRLTVHTATLFAAGCCIPAILSLVSMWNKILMVNWKDRFGHSNQEKAVEDSREDKDGPELSRFKSKTETIRHADMKKMNDVIRFFLTAIEVPVFGAAVLAILIIGERNFWSPEVNYQTEPIKAVGQWAPIAGTTLAVLGSLYILAASRVFGPTNQDEKKPNAQQHHCCDCLVREDTRGRRRIPRSPSRYPPQSGDIGEAANLRHSISLDEKEYSLEIETKQQSLAENHPIPGQKEEESGAGHRGEVAKGIIKLIRSFGTAAPDTFDDSGFKLGKSADFPETPGERLKNDNLEKTKESFKKIREADESYRVRAASFAASMRSRRSDEDLAETSRVDSPPHSPTVLHTQSGFLSPPGLTTARNEMLPAIRLEGDCESSGPSSDVKIESHEG